MILALNLLGSSQNISFIGNFCSFIENLVQLT